jgi:hypothetical protein
MVKATLKVLRIPNLVKIAASSDTKIMVKFGGYEGISRNQF